MFNGRMRQRRFSITEDQARAVRLGLALYIQEMYDTKCEYDKWLKPIAIDLFKKLTEYKWRV